MKYIEIKEGLSIRVDEIEAIGLGDNDLTSMVYTHHNAYKSTFPYNVLLELLMAKTHEEEESSDRQKRQFNIMKEMGNFAGR